jgi:hypothetical protein
MTIKVHFDGKAFIPDEPVNLPPGTSAQVEHPDLPVKNDFVTAAELLDSGVVGIWADRKDIGDSVEYARQLRQRAQQREI